VFSYRLTNEQLCNDTDGRQNYCFELKVEMKVSNGNDRRIGAVSAGSSRLFCFWRAFYAWPSLQPSSPAIFPVLARTIFNSSGCRLSVARLAAQFFHVDVYRREADHGEQRIAAADAGC